MTEQELQQAIEDDRYNAFVRIDPEGFAAARAASAERSRAVKLSLEEDRDRRIA